MNIFVLCNSKSPTKPQCSKCFKWMNLNIMNNTGEWMNVINGFQKNFLSIPAFLTDIVFINNFLVKPFFITNTKSQLPNCHLFLLWYSMNYWLFIRFSNTSQLLLTHSLDVKSLPGQLDNHIKENEVRPLPHTKYKN